MAKNVGSFFIVLDEDISEEEALLVISALKLIKGVIAVEPRPAHGSDIIANARVRRDLLAKFVAFMDSL